MNKNEPEINTDPQSASRIEAYKEFGAYERHFNQMQSVCRGFASTWLLATLGGIGYALWNEEFLVSGFGGANRRTVTQPVLKDHSPRAPLLDRLD